MLTAFLPSSAAASIYLFKPPYAIGSVPSLSGHSIAYRWRSLLRVCRHRASKPQGSSERVLPWQVTMDQFICASLSHTHYWYKVGLLKVPDSYSYMLHSPTINTSRTRVSRLLYTFYRRLLMRRDYRPIIITLAHPENYGGSSYLITSTAGI